MKSKRRECITNMQWLCKSWRRDGFVPCKSKPAQETQRSVRKLSRKGEDPRSIALEFIEVCGQLNWNHGRSTPRRSETHGIAERAVRQVKKKVLRQYQFSLDCKKAGGRSHGVFLLSPKYAGPFKPTADVMNVGSIHHFKGRLFHMEHKYNPIQHHQMTKVECISSSQKSFLGYSWDTNAGGSWTVDLFMVDTQDVKTVPPSNRGGHSQEKQRICISMWDGRILARRTSVIHRYIHRNHVPPRTKPLCSEGRFSDTSELH